MRQTVTRTEFHKTPGYISQKAFPIVGLSGLKIPAASRLDCLTACLGEP